MEHIRQVARSLLFRYGWDTRCRNLAAVRILRSLMANLSSQTGPFILDVGCGQYGLASFLQGVQVVGTDLEFPAAGIGERAFLCGSIDALPFRTQSFPVVTCIDVLEHLSIADR